MGMSGRPRPRRIVESLNHQYPPRQQQPTYNQQVLVSEDGQADAPSQEFPMTIRSLIHSQQEQAEDTRLPHLYSDDVMLNPLHPHVKALENRNKHELPPGKVNDVQNTLVDSGRNEHSTVRLQAQRYAKQRADSHPTREGFVNQRQKHINPQFPQQSSAAIVTQNSQSYRRPPQQSENHPFDEEYAISRANQLTERDFSETTHQSKPISLQRYTQEDITHFTQSSFYKHQSSTSRLSSRPSRQPASPRTTPEKSRDSSRMSSNSHQVALKPYIMWFPHYETDPRILMEQTGSADAVHNWLEVANTREEGSDGEETGERAEKLLTECSDDTLDIFDQVQFKLRTEIPLHDSVLSMISPYPSTQVIYIGRLAAHSRALSGRGWNCLDVEYPHRKVG
ncbi:hypothetical protein BLNAU_23471 [Blattamonas nauphoetae]|uniref:Uncharacterized protein n=1 Tax=Blattamonas nauphoetae TaxID=2049346 RepID=A0ABQ9WQ45_9EUKA|nr:hypothetical protein BLNAU_23471 [Blattamonas nauphoetae]